MCEKRDDNKFMMPQFKDYIRMFYFQLMFSLFDINKVNTKTVISLS